MSVLSSVNVTPSLLQLYQAAASGGEYSKTDDGRVRPKHVLIELEK
jgi:hypothetical protein